MATTRSKAKATTTSKAYPRLIASVWLLFLGVMLTLVLYVYAVSINFLNLFGELPDLKTLENPKSELASEVYSADNVLMGKYFRENRSPVEYEELPQNLVDALVATEDIRFEEHSGIDFKGSFAIVYYKLLGHQDRGSSTITQQLARNLFRTRSDLNNGLLSDVPGLRTLIIKSKEWIMAIKLERSYSKKEILTMYLNTVDFGSNAFGIKVAAKTFFNKAPKDLEVEESALLVGLLKGPSFYSPVNRPERSKNRRNTVLSQMHKYHLLDEEAFAQAKAKDIKLVYSVENQNKGMAPYFRTEASKALLKWCKENGYDLYADGLKIHTTIDSRMQRYAEEAVEQHMKAQQALFNDHWKGRNPWVDANFKEIPNFIETGVRRTQRYKNLERTYDGEKDSINFYLKKKIPMTVFSWKGEKDTVMSPIDSLKYYKRMLHAGFMAMNPSNGHIKAWVGGTNYKYFKYDHVKQGTRQPGSTFKPFLYAAAIDAGYSPCYEVADVQYNISLADGKVWSPHNSDNKFSGTNLSLRQALGESVNSVSAFLVNKLGPATLVKYAKEMGISTPLEEYPSLALGSSDVSLYDMVGAYGTFVNQGTWMEPISIVRIEDKNGNVLKEFVPNSREVMSEESAYIMVHMLKAPAERGGTAYYGLRVRNKLLNEIGGKTGTTSNLSDAWFMGITPDLVCGVWVGGEDRSIHFRTMALGQGNKLAMPIYGSFMQKVYGDKNLAVSKEPFPKPSAPLTIELNCDRYKYGFVSDSTQHQMLTVPSFEDEI
ncbi:transglycosylase domain-containing protein [soil metagenome]